MLPTSSCAAMQLRDLNKGTFGFVQLALDTDSNTQVAIKFIERGDKVGCKALQSGLEHIRMCCCLAACLNAICVLQISKYVEREILNHKRLNHPHIVELKEVSTAATKSGLHRLLPPRRTPRQSLPLSGSQQLSRTKQRIHRAWQAVHACPAAAHLLAGGPARQNPAFRGAHLDCRNPAHFPTSRCF